MRLNASFLRWGVLGVGAAMLCGVSACSSNSERAKRTQQIEQLQRETDRLERAIAQRDGDIAARDRQIEQLKGFASDRPADLFAPARIEIASLSGGADYDGAPGDDGITVHLRPRDRDGDVVKASGRIRIQILDNTDLASPRVVGVYEFGHPDELRKTWHARFGTHHYSLKCPFPPDATLPDSRKLTVAVEFIDYLTGATLTATKEVGFSVATP